MITKAKERMLPALRRIWMECFGDDQAYIDFIFERLLTPGHIIVCTDGNGEPEAMLCYQPHELAVKGEALQGVYIFGVATTPASQGRGIGTKLLEKSHGYFSKQGYSHSILVPASDSLFGYYRERGYQTRFYTKIAKVDADEIAPPSGIPPCVLVKRELDSLAALREDCFAGGSMFVRWDIDYLRFTGMENSFKGGQTLMASCAGSKGYVVCYPHEDKLYVKELAMPQEYLESLLAALHSRFRKGQYVLNLRTDTAINHSSAVLPYAMVKWYDRERTLDSTEEKEAPCYIAHVLD